MRVGKVENSSFLNLKNVIVRYYRPIHEKIHVSGGGGAKLKVFL